MASPAEDYVLLGLRLGRHVDGLVDSYCGPGGAAGAGRGGAAHRAGRARRAGRGAARAARGRLAARPGARPAHLRGRARGRGALVLGRGRALLRRPARRRGAPTSTRPSTSGSTSCSAGRGDLAERYEAWRQANLVPPRPGRSALPRPARRAARTAPRRSSTCRPARRSTSRRFATSPGGRSTTTRAISAAGSSSTSTSRRPATTSSSSSPTRSTRATTPSTRVKEQLPPPRPGPGSRSRSSSCRPPPRSSARASPRPGPTLVVDGDAAERIAAIFRVARARVRPRASARAIREARRPIRRIGLDAALMIHEDGASTEEAEAYVPALGAVHARAGGAQRALRRRSDLARLRDQLLRRPGARPRLGRRRPGAVPRGC